MKWWLIIVSGIAVIAAIAGYYLNVLSDGSIAYAEATQTAQALRGGLADHPDLLFAGYTQDALKEYAEAQLVYAFLHGDEPPGPATIQVDPAAYLNGLAEAASELRRAILDGL